MSQLKITDDGDIDITSGQLSLVDGGAEVRQRILQNLRTFRSEWFLDVNIGVPYFEIVFDKGASPDLVKSVFVVEIINTNGVAELSRLSDFDLSVNRNLSFDFDVRTIENEILTIEV